MTFKTPPDYETQSSYSIVVKAAANGKHATRDVTINITDVNELAEVHGWGSREKKEHSSTDVASYSVRDPEGDPLTITVTGWSLSGTDAGDFSLDEDEGEQWLKFKSMPNYENPVDHNKDNVYRVNVNAATSGGTFTKTVTVTVTDIPPEEEPVVITGPTTASINENRTGNLVRLTASSDAGPLTWTCDCDSKITVTNGWLRVTSPLDYEVEGPQFTERVTVTNAHGASATHTVTVTVNNVNEPPVISGDASVELDEHQTMNVGQYTATDPEGDAVTLSLAGTDRGDFNIDDGTLTFRSMPNYERPVDSNKNNVYHVTVRATANGQVSSKAVTVTIRDRAPGLEPLTLTGGATASINENLTGHLASYTAKSDIGPFTWTVAEKRILSPTSLEFVPHDSFSIANGALRVQSALDHEAQSTYTLRVSVSNPHKRTDHEVVVTVNNVDEPPVISGLASVTRNEATGTSTDWSVATYQAVDPEGDAISWSLSGTDAGDFSIDNGALSFSSAPDYESPADNNKDNQYSVTLQATAGGKNDTHNVTVTVANVDEPPVINGPGTVEFPENGTGNVASYTATDPEGAATTLELIRRHGCTSPWSPMARSGSRRRPTTRPLTTYSASAASFGRQHFRLLKSTSRST